MALVWTGGEAVLPAQVEIAAGTRRSNGLRLTVSGGAMLESASEGTGGEDLSERQVSALPLNKRDFSQLLLLAAGTQTDTNGAANFTQQFTVNGQRGSATVFAMDGTDTTDPEMGGATFSNFNVDAIQEIRSSSGVLNADLGHGAAGFTELVTKSGANELHGSVFEFVRNAALDARNFFDRRSLAQPGRIPPFNRNEFGFTNGGPVRLPGIYDGRDRTYYFGQYQGFRQVLGTTQILPVPTADERTGLDTTAFPGDTLAIPVDSRIAAVLARYPLPNDPSGPYGKRTYATSSKVRTVSDQFSVRVDHRVSGRLQLFGRFNFNNVDGPLTNPTQTAIDPSICDPLPGSPEERRPFRYFHPFFQFCFGDLSRFRSRHSVASLHKTIPNRLISLRTGCTNLSTSRVAPRSAHMAISCRRVRTPRGSGLPTSGRPVSRPGSTWTRPCSVSNPNGFYTFGGGAAYAPVTIRSASGTHDIRAGDPLPDALSGFLTATPFSFTITAASPMFPQGEQMGESAVRRYAYNFFFRDTWQVAPKFTLSYGMRYELSTRISEKNHLTSGVFPGDSAVTTRLLINPQPPYPMDWNGSSPRLVLDWRIDDRTVLRAGTSMMPLLLNLWQMNCVTAGLPFTVLLYGAAAPGAPVPFQTPVPAIPLPDVYTPGGTKVFATSNSTDVPPGTRNGRDTLRARHGLTQPGRPGAPCSPDGDGPEPGQRLHRQLDIRA